MTKTKKIAPALSEAPVPWQPLSRDNAIRLIQADIDHQKHVTNDFAKRLDSGEALSSVVRWVAERSLVAEAVAGHYEMLLRIEAAGEHGDLLHLLKVRAVELRAEAFRYDPTSQSTSAFSNAVEAARHRALHTIIERYECLAHAMREEA